MKDSISLGAGCFWGVEALFSKMDGVTKVTSGYTGGALVNPSYVDICTGSTGHAEVVLVEFDTEIVSLRDVLIYFFRLHDPTTLNKQGPDIGTQYRSVIFYNTDKQREVAKELIKHLNTTHFNNSIVTEVTKSQTFYPAEEYHQDYYNKKYQGQSGPICHFLSDIKID